MSFFALLYAVAVNAYLFLDPALPVTRNNLVFFSYFLPFFFQFRKPDSNIAIYLLVPITAMMFGAYSAQLHLISPDAFGKQWIRNVYYAIVIALSISYRLLSLERFKEIVLLAVVCFYSLFFVLDISGGAALGGFLALWTFQKKKEISKLGMLSIVLFLFFFLFSISWNSGSWDRLENILYFINFILIAHLLYSQRKIQFRSLRIWISVLVGSQVLWLTFYFYKSGAVQNSGDILLSGVHLSQVGALSLLGAMFLPKGDSRTHAFLKWALLGLYVFSVYISKSRISQLAFVILLASHFSYSYRSYFQKNFSKGIFALASILLFFLFLFLYTNPKSLDSQSLGVRFSIWAFHWQQTGEHALWFGFGPLSENVLYFQPNYSLDPILLTTIREYLDHFHSYPQAHNVFLEWFSSFGLSGMLFLFCGLVCIALRFKSNWLVLGLGVFLLHGNFDLNLMEPPLFYPLAAIVGVSVRFSGRVRTRNLETHFSKILAFLLFIAFLHSFAKTHTLEKHRFYLSDQFVFDNLSVAKFQLNSFPIRKDFSCSQFDLMRGILRSERLSQYQFLCESKQLQWKEDLSDWNKSLEYLFFQFPKNPENLNLILHWWGSRNPGPLLEEVKHLKVILDPLQIL